MAQTFTATSSLIIKAEPSAVWAALSDPETVSKAFFGAKVDTDWQPGSPITFSGQWQGKSFEDKGEVLENTPAQTLRFTHFSPLTGQPDVPENYHTVTFKLAPESGGTRVTIVQTNAASEQERQHSEENWAQVLSALREAVER
ncbi:hypothetical protein Rhe02_45960 [Rhizocola hellebori]|uniref:Activator of Hsp90 ATPase homologue 1/2-like C-terminal domain-containing protein n=1 Tax=Rhizocola hellebori TaxID=1392758 RepID=A0A8J3QAQ6_9ACTN|nr:SRPBCC family protein [Rhizocola hellebori]GIH06529.1 hypothetical protein Rhe02_45960 [Rhizocola hellebori]